MSAAYRRLGVQLRQALWVEPTVALVLGAAAGFGAPLLERSLTPGPAFEAGSAANAAVLLSSIAGALATILGVTFSLTVVTLQLTATQYTSRLLRRFMSDGVTKVVLGVYLGSVAYLLLVIRALPAAEAGNPAPLSTLLGVVLALLCLVLFAVFLHHISQVVEQATIAAEVANDTVRQIRESKKDASSWTPSPTPEDWRLEEELRSEHPGFLQVIDYDELCQALSSAANRARVEVPSGAFVIPGTPLVRLDKPLSSDAQRAALAAFAFSSERDLGQDFLYGVRQLNDVALRALSPGINDPTTAIRVANELSWIFATAVREGVVTHDRWETRSHPLELARPRVDLGLLVEDCWYELLVAAGPHARVLATILDRFDALLPDLDVRGRGLLSAAVRRALRSARHSGVLDEDLQWLRRRSARLLAPGSQPSLH